MKTLVVYYSRTGHTKKVAEAISNFLDCDIEEIVDTQNRSGPLGYLRSGYQAMRKKLPTIEKIKKDPSQYDLVVIGTPIWAKTISSPIRTYLYQNREHFKKIAFFCTYGSGGAETAFAEMEKLCSINPVSTLDVKTKEAKKGDYIPKVENFINEIEK
ncbi:MAG: flavodoxin family protein [Candidatus Methanofastidiosia archaeon]